MFKRLTLQVGILALAMIMAGFAVAQDMPAQEQQSMSITGTVVSSTATSLTIRTAAGEEMTFNVDSSSQLATSMTPGAQIKVEYHPLAGGTYHAASVSAMGATTAETPASPTETQAANEPVAGAEEEALPGTASPLPVVGLLGLLALGAWLGMRRLRRHPNV